MRFSRATSARRTKAATSTSSRGPLRCPSRRSTEGAARAFVSGATGFVGLNLVGLLAHEGWRVVALHRPGSELKHLARLPAERVQGDVTDRASLERALPAALDAVFHVAGDTGLWSRRNALQDRINIEGTRNVVEAVLARGLDAVILNPAAIIGRHDMRGWGRMIRLACAGKLPGVPPGGTSFCHVCEVVRAHLAAAERGHSGENYLLGGTDANFSQLMQVIREVTGCEVPAQTLPAWLLIAGAARAVELVSDRPRAGAHARGRGARDAPHHLRLRKGQARARVPPGAAARDGRRERRLARRRGAGAPAGSLDSLKRASWTLRHAG